MFDLLCRCDTRSSCLLLTCRCCAKQTCSRCAGVERHDRPVVAPHQQQPSAGHAARGKEGFGVRAVRAGKVTSLSCMHPFPGRNLPVACSCWGTQVLPSIKWVPVVHLDRRQGFGHVHPWWPVPKQAHHLHSTTSSTTQSSCITTACAPPCSPVHRASASCPSSP